MTARVVVDSATTGEFRVLYASFSFCPFLLLPPPFFDADKPLLGLSNIHVLRISLGC